VQAGKSAGANLNVRLHMQKEVSRSSPVYIMGRDDATRNEIQTLTPPIIVFFLFSFYCKIIAALKILITATYK
jgi:hypothetical protein